MGNITTLTEMLDNAQLLKELHIVIAENQLDITSKDDLNAQIIEIDDYLGRNEYAQLLHKKNRVNIGTGILALPILLFCILLFAGKYSHYFSIGFDHQALLAQIFQLAFQNIGFILVYAILLFGLIIYFYRLNNQSKQAIQHTVALLMQQLERSNRGSKSI